MAGLIDAANVDLKAFNDKFYRERCKAQLEPVRQAIRLMHEASIHVEVTTLLIPEFNDDEGELQRLAEFLAGVSADIPWHVSRYHPDYQFDRAPVTPEATILHALAMGRKGRPQVSLRRQHRRGRFREHALPGLQGGGHSALRLLRARGRAGRVEL